MRYSILYFIVVCPILFISQTDSIKEKRTSKFFFNLSYGIGLKDAKINYSEKYNQADLYDFERESFYFKTPEFGLTYLYKKRSFLFQAGLAYSYAMKKIDKSYYGNSRDIDDYVNAKNVFPFPIYFSSNEFPVGTHYFKYTDMIKANLALQYLHFDVLVGRKIYKGISVTTGFKVNKVLTYSLKGEIQREASEYIITGYISQGWPKDSLISQSNITYTNEIQGKIVQNIRGNFYWRVGTNYVFKIGSLKQTFLLNVLYDINLPRRSYSLRDYITASIGMSF